MEWKNPEIRPSTRPLFTWSGRSADWKVKKIPDPLIYKIFRGKFSQYRGIIKSCKDQFAPILDQLGPYGSWSWSKIGHFEHLLRKGSTLEQISCTQGYNKKVQSIILNPFGTTSDHMGDHWCSRWPRLGWRQLPCDLRWSLRVQIILKTFYYNLMWWKFALNCFLGTKGAQDVQVGTGPGFHMVQGGLEWVQNYPYNFLLHPVLQKFALKGFL